MMICDVCGVKDWDSYIIKGLNLCQPHFKKFIQDARKNKEIE